MKDGLNEEAKTGVCPVCGNEFERKGLKKYCSHGCYCKAAEERAVSRGRRKKGEHKK